MTLEQWARMPAGAIIRYLYFPGESTFKTAIKRGWIESVPNGEAVWWRMEYRLTDAGRAALAGEGA